MAIALLRYHGTFKVRKFELLFYKINTCLQKTTTCIRLRAGQIFSVNIQNIYFSILDVAFAVPFLCYFQKFQFVVRNFELIFAALYFYVYELSVSQTFKILFQTGDICPSWFLDMFN